MSFPLATGLHVTVYIKSRKQVYDTYLFAKTSRTALVSTRPPTRSGYRRLLPRTKTTAAYG